MCGESEALISNEWWCLSSAVAIFLGYDACKFLSLSLGKTALIWVKIK